MSMFTNTQSVSVLTARMLYLYQLERQVFNEHNPIAGITQNIQLNTCAFNSDFQFHLALQ